MVLGPGRQQQRSNEEGTQRNRQVVRSWRVSFVPIRLMASGSFFFLPPKIPKNLLQWPLFLFRGFGGLNTVGVSCRFCAFCPGTPLPAVTALRRLGRAATKNVREKRTHRIRRGRARHEVHIIAWVGSLRYTPLRAWRDTKAWQFPEYPHRSPPHPPRRAFRMVAHPGNLAKIVALIMKSAHIGAAVAPPDRPRS